MISNKLRAYNKLIRASNVYDVAEVTPITKANTLSRQLKNNIFLKCEDFQPVFSFKVRGAYNKISKIKKISPDRPVIAASAGNHAQGVAYSAKKLGLKSIIVMPITTPLIKINAVKSLGGKVVFFGDNFDEAYNHAVSLAKKENYSFIHPYDDKEVISGQGTIGKEIIEQTDSKIEAVFVPVGGGGLLAGVGAYI